MMKIVAKTQAVRKRFENWFNNRFSWFFTNGNKTNPFAGSEKGS